MPYRRRTCVIQTSGNDNPDSPASTLTNRHLVCDSGHTYLRRPVPMSGAYVRSVRKFQTVGGACHRTGGPSSSAPQTKPEPSPTQPRPINVKDLQTHENKPLSTNPAHVREGDRPLRYDDG